MSGVGNAKRSKFVIINGTQVSHIHGFYFDSGRKEEPDFLSTNIVGLKNK